MLTTCLNGWVPGWVALEEWKLRLTSAKVEVEVEAELAKMTTEAVKCQQKLSQIFKFSHFVTIYDKYFQVFTHFVTIVHK